MDGDDGASELGYWDWWGRLAKAAMRSQNHDIPVMILKMEEGEQFENNNMVQARTSWENQVAGDVTVAWLVDELSEVTWWGTAILQHVTIEAGHCHYQIT